jgi:hypothetical protein
MSETMNLSQQEFDRKKDKMNKLISEARSLLSSYDLDDRSSQGGQEDLDGDTVLPNLEMVFNVGELLFRLESSYNIFSPDRKWGGIRFTGGGYTSKGHDWSEADARELLSLTQDVYRIIDKANSIIGE